MGTRFLTLNNDLMTDSDINTDVTDIDVNLLREMIEENFKKIDKCIEELREINKE